MHSVWLRSLAPLRRRQAGRQRPVLRRLSRLRPERATAMNAKRKILLAVIAVAVVLAGGAFAWKNGKAHRRRQRRRRQRKPADRPLELIAGRAPHDQAARPGRRRALHRHHPADRPDDREGARRRPPGRGAGARRRPGHQGPGAGALRDHRAAVQGQRTPVGARCRPRRRALDGARPLRQGDAGQPQHRLAVGRRPGARDGREQGLHGGRRRGPARDRRRGTWPTPR